MVYYPSYLDDEQNFGSPSFQVTFKNAEGSRLRRLFRQWKEARHDYLMMRTNPQYKFSKRATVNNPRHLTITGKLAKVDDRLSASSGAMTLDDELELQADEDNLKMLRQTALTTKKKKQKKISALVNVDVSSSQK